MGGGAGGFGGSGALGGIAAADVVDNLEAGGAYTGVAVTVAGGSGGGGNNGAPFTGVSRLYVVGTGCILLGVVLPVPATVGP